MGSRQAGLAIANNRYLTILYDLFGGARFQECCTRTREVVNLHVLQLGALAVLPRGPL